jgi:hypothetical protein
MIQVVLKSRYDSIEYLIQECASGRLPFTGPGSLHEKVAAMGFKTTSLYEMVCAAETKQTALAKAKGAQS